MVRSTEKAYTEMELKKLIQQEIKECFEQLTTDVKDIKQALLGSEYNKGGLVSLVQKHEGYIEKSEAMHIIDRALPAIEWYESWEKNEEFKKIEEVLDTYSKWKWFVGLLAGGSLAGMISAIVTVIELIQKLPI